MAPHDVSFGALLAVNALRASSIPVAAAPTKSALQPMSGSVVRPGGPESDAAWRVSALTEAGPDIILP